MTTFIALFDLHYGEEKKNGLRNQLHDPKAVEAVFKFAQDLKPDRIILGGDMLDCGVISHHNKEKRRTTEGLRLLADMEGLRKDVLNEIERLTEGPLVYHVGNHEDWIDQMIDENPSIEGIISLRNGLKLSDRWTIIPQGGVSKLGKLHFVHGDQVKGGQHPAKWAVDTFERSIRFGHFHKAQLHTKMSALDVRDVRTGMSVPALCNRAPGYGKGAPNQWSKGFLWGYVLPDGSFNDYLTVIHDGKFVANGKQYRA
jgi:UDP-2,3-diacylglucosamine pyrophosphatase LpxH